jgi:hypothetical protein
MAKVYVARCIVKRDGKSYEKGSVIKGLTDKEIKQGLAEHWLEAVGNDDGGAKDAELTEQTEKKPAKPPTNKKTGKPEESKPDDLEKKTVDELIAIAGGLGLQTESSMPEETLRRVIREARQ